jgi:hypothetical protein
MDKQQTLPEAFKLSQEWYDETTKRIEKNYGEITEKISDYIEIEANNVRDEEFGEVNVEITRYERKLLLVGYLIGLQRVNSADTIGSFLEFLMRQGKGGE